MTENDKVLVLVKNNNTVLNNIVKKISKKLIEHSSSPGILLYADLLWDRERENEEETEKKQGKSLVCVPVVRHL